MSQQLPLGIALQPRAAFSNFIVGDNGEALSRLRLERDPFIYLWGGTGCGKTHLLQACCRDSGAGSGYIPLREIASLQPAMLEGMESMALVCVDDLEQLSAQRAWELALFNLFNRLRERGARLLVAADRPPARLTLTLHDLASRLVWGPCYQLAALDDEGRLQLLMQQAQERGLRLSADTARFLLQRLPRDAHHLTRIMERLDQASLAAKHRLTLPFVRKVLQL